MRKPTGLNILGGAALLLASCGSAGNETNDGQASTNVANSGWDATNACALLDNSAVGAALDDNVTETSLAMVSQALGANAATSECTYMLESGGRASLMARNSPIADNTDDAIKLARNATQETVSAFTDKKIEDVPGMGKAAFFVPGINQLNMFIDDKRFVILTISSAADDRAKATAIELAKNIKS